MEGREKVYTICDNMCLEESLTKEQIEDTVDEQVRSYGVPTNGVLRFDGTEAQIPGGYEKVTDLDDLGTIVNLFGDVLGTNSTETLSLNAHIVATKISTKVWKFDIEGQMDIANPQNNYEWGIMPSKISALLNAAIGKQVQYDPSLRTQGNWSIFKTSDNTPYINYYNYGTSYEYNVNQYLLFARYYTTDGSIGGYNTQAFESSTHVYATIYLKEV